MQTQLDPLTALTATGVAGYVAIIADWVARYDLGLSEGQIRSMALVAAALIAVGLAANLLAKRPGKVE
jgi:HD-GYP domain-containing protein (c-di-GMP phosphodiesterase class II)